MSEPKRTQKKILRKMLYLKDQKGILNRYFREPEGWQKHIDRCHDFIIRDLRERRPGRITVLGSGWLLDFPLEEALELAGQITLIDIVHPAQVVAKVKKLERVDLVELDITGSLIRQVYDSVRSSVSIKEKVSLTEFNFRPGMEFPEEDFLVSLNVLTQLDILLVDYITEYWDYSESELNEFRKQIQSAHMDLLNPRKGILLTDFMEKQFDESGKKITERSLVHVPLPSSRNSENWTWEFDTEGRYIEGMRVELEVQAMSF